MKFEKSLKPLDEIVMAGMSVKLDIAPSYGYSDDGSESTKKPGYALFYDVTNDTKSQLENDVYNCIIGGPEHGNSVRFIANNNNKKFIVFRPDVLHYKAAAQLGLKYPVDENILYGEGWIKIPSSSMKIDDIEFRTLKEMPRDRKSKKFLEKLLGDGQRWKWADKWGDVTDALFSCILTDDYWKEQRQSHYEAAMVKDNETKSE